VKFARAFTALVLTTLLLPADAKAQSTSPTGNLYGTVLDAQGAPASGVAVTISGPGAAQTSNTDARGDFHFLNLSPGAYSVWLERAGFGTVRRDVTVTLGNAVLSIVMPIAGVSEAVTVAGDAPLDSRTIQTGATFGQKELESIPTTRDPWAILRQVPGVLVANMNVGGGRRSRQSAFVGKGSSPGQNSYSLNGVTISQGGVSPLYYDFDSFSSIEVTTGGSDPSLGTPGVTLNLVTKRGTNELLGSARALYTGGAGWDYGIGIGGPVWKDRLWLWGAAARNAFLGQTFYAATEPGEPGDPVENQETLKHWNVKLNAELLASNTLTLSYTGFDRVSLGLGVDPDRSLPTTLTNTLDSQVFNVADSQVLSAGFFASLSLSYVKAAPVTTPLGGLAEQADVDVDSIWRHSYSAWRAEDTQHQAGLSTSTFFDTGRLSHELKFGFGYRHARLDSASTWPGDLMIGSAPLRQAGITRLQNAKSYVNTYDAFVGDTIRTGNLTLNVGARFDYQQGKNLASTVPANPVFPELLPAVRYGGNAGYPITWRTFQPRVGATYALGKDPSTLLRASYARFADQLGNEVRTINAFPSIAYLYYEWKDRNRNDRVEASEVATQNGFLFALGVDPEDPGSAAPVNTISTSLVPPTTDEFIVGVERKIFPDLSASLAYTNRVTRHVTFSPLIGTTRDSYQYSGNATGTAVAESNGFVLDFSEPYYGLMQCPDPCVATVLENRPDSSNTYQGVELEVMKAYSHGWTARVSFAYNDWQQHVGPAGVVNPNNETPGTNASGPFVLGGINANWQFNVSGTVELPLGVAAGVNFFGRQGFPTPYWVEVVADAPYFALPGIQIGPATRFRTPNVYELDFQLSRVFRIGTAVSVIPQFACFNLLDSHTVLQREGFVGTYDATLEPAFDKNPGFNAVSSTLSGRVYRGGVRIDF